MALFSMNAKQNVAPVAPVAPMGTAPVAPVAPMGTAPVAPVAPMGTAPVAPVAPMGTAPVAPVAPMGTAPVAPVAPMGTAPVAPMGTAPVAPMATEQPVEEKAQRLDLSAQYPTCDTVEKLEAVFTAEMNGEKLTGSMKRYLAVSAIIDWIKANEKALPAYVVSCAKAHSPAKFGIAKSPAGFAATPYTAAQRTLCDIIGVAYEDLPKIAVGTQFTEEQAYKATHEGRSFMRRIMGDLVKNPKNYKAINLVFDENTGVYTVSAIQ